MKDLSNIQLPVIAAPMFLVSGVDLVVACCKNGIVGTFPSLNGRTYEDFVQMLEDITQQLEQYRTETGNEPAPFGVNLIVNHTNSRLMADLQACAKYKVPLIITSLGAVKEIVDAVHEWGGIIFHDVIKKRHAEKAAEAGVDGIICVANGAGGHAGTAHPFALINEIKQFFKGKIILSGCINTGDEVLAAQTIGAEYAYIGTRFIATQESMASDDYKQMILHSTIEDIIYTNKISGVHAYFMKSSIQKANIDLDKLGVEAFSMDASEAKAWKNIWSAGQGVTEINDIPNTEALIHSIKQQYKEALIRNNNLFNQLKF